MFSFMLAPLEDFSNNAMRTLCFRHGADLTFTEMARVEGFVRRNKPTLTKIAISDSTPVQIQLLLGTEAPLEKFLSTFKPFEGFMGFNLNLSCPSPNVISQGRGAAMVKRTSKTQKLVSIIKKNDYPVSVKLRLGTNNFEKQHKVYLNSIKNVDADFFVVHAKTAEQESFEPTDDSIYLNCVDAAKINGKKIIANGGINSSKKVKELISVGVDGVMIGYGAMFNPAIFDLLKNELGFNSPKKVIPSIPEIKTEYLEISDLFGAQSKYRTNLIPYLGKKH